MKRLEDFVRLGESPRDLGLLLRGGTDTTSKLVAHADRLVDRFTYRDRPARGLSLFAANGDLEKWAILGGRLGTYRTYREAEALEVRRVGILVPTFDAPHWTLLLGHDEVEPHPALPDPIDQLLAILGPSLRNPRYRSRHAHRR